MLILEDLWEGKVPFHDKHIRKGSAYEGLTGQLVEAEAMLRKDLSAEQKQFYDVYCAKQAELTEIAERDSFIRGVRLGARIVLDVLGEYHSQLPLLGEEEAGHQ